MFEMKATLYSKGNMAAYIRELVRNDNRPVKPMPLCRCGNTALNIIYKDEERQISVDDQDHTIILKGVPRSSCPECGAIAGDLRLAAKLEAVLDDEIQYRLNKRMTVPNQLEFQELITV